jgi:hypothetical protein
MRLRSDLPPNSISRNYKTELIHVSFTFNRLVCMGP